VNDSLGRQAATLLKQLAGAGARRDRIARISGDVFAIVLHGEGEEG
jgi:GGDEF domain-containing protein